MTEELTKQCEEYESRMKTQDEQLVIREVKLQELQAKVKVSRVNKNLNFRH